MNKLDILGVYNLAEDHHSKHYTDIRLNYHITNHDSHLGDQLYIELPDNLSFNDEVFIGIDFIHQDNNPSLKIIDNNQFGSINFLYTDNSPVKSRSLFPCMDTPLVKSSYRAKLLVPNGYKALFSGVLEKSKKVSMGNILKHKFYYSQASPISTHMVGLLVAQIEQEEMNGNIVYYQLENQSKIKNLKTVELFNNIDTYIKEIENLFKNLKQSFKPVSFVIMPRMFHFKSYSFKNLIFLNVNIFDDIDHFVLNVSNEIVESSISSIINHSCWRHAALSSGLSKFVERLLIRSIEGKDISELHKNLGEIELYDTIEEYQNDHRTSMYPELRNLQPKEYVSDVSKEKGFTFFNFLNQGIGKENLIDIIEIMATYFNKEGMNYSDFGMNYIDRVRKLLRFRHHEVLNQIDWDLWLFGQGEPPYNMIYGKIKIIIKIHQLLKKYQI